ncbi:MAG TPA: hypothetical protein VJH03_07170 [Blastocatellia bacterium]|nr:hypothetical protein [Blastocatellia bacterium]
MATAQNLIKIGLTKTQKWLLAVSACLLAVAEVIRRIPMDRRTVVFVGVGEMLMALSLGIAFGVDAARRNE